MTIDQAVALSLVDDLSRVDLTARLHAADPELLELATGEAARAREIRARAAAAGIHVLAWNDPRFPASLLALTDCPPVLWYRGTLDCLAAPAIAIVGSRAASAVSLEVAARMGADLAAHGLTVVSGLARGVDSAAHRGALREGRTIAVLGSGVDCIYPREHAGLADDIAGAGLVVSEYPPGARPVAFRFPQRNRLISGLSRAVVVIEASERSGSLITAACALEQGREVMAVPGNALSGRNRGGHALIRDGARIVETAADVLDELGLDVGTEAADEPPTLKRSTRCGDSLLHGMTVGEPYDLDALAAASGLDVARVVIRLSTLELQGRVARLEGGRFVRRA